MRVLILHDEQRRPDIRPLFRALANQAEVRIEALPVGATEQLPQWLSRFDAGSYDRLILALQFRRLRKQARCLRRLNNLILFEEDACQDRLPQSKWHKQFSRFYRALPQARVICTGKNLTDYFVQQGVDAGFLPKGADCTQLRDQGQPRPVELGFVGVINDRVYRERMRVMQLLSEQAGLQCLRTQVGDDYVRTLNQIQVFVSADISFGEYMFKNAEAMACGCLLLAYSQGEAEDAAMGFVDGQNVVLYRNESQLLEKVAWLRAHPAECERIRLAGTAHVQQVLDFTVLGQRFFALLVPPLRDGSTGNRSASRRPWWRFW